MSEWEVVQALRSGSLSREEVSCRATEIDKNGYYRVQITIGLEIADLCEMYKGTRVLFLRNKVKETKFLIKKSDLKETFKLCSGTKANGYNFNVRVKTHLKFYTGRTRRVDYELNNDKSIALDIKNLILTGE